MLAAGTTLGPYRILAPLGAGGMGEVYRARDTRLGRDVALKVIHADVARDPDRIKRFEQEARAASALSHPNVCAIYDIGTHEGSPFVVMELLEGESLREKLRAGPIPARKAIDYAAQAAHGLAAAHEKGIIHRDLKPENLFVTKDGRVKVLDFGLAKLTRPDVVAGAGEPTVSIAATETGAILGTVGYMSPEQVRGEAADARSDIFSLGTILYELLTGRRAFAGASYAEKLSAILKDEPPPLSATGRDIPPTLEPIIHRCLEKSPDERFQNARDLAFDLESIGSGQMAGAPVTAPSPRHRRRLAWAVAAAAIVLVGVGVWLAWGSLSVWLGGQHAAQPTKKDWILVAEFDSPPGDSAVAEAARSLISSALDQSAIVATVPRGQIQLALETAGKPATSRVNAELARELAYRSNVRAVLEGRIDHLGRGYSVTVQMVDVDSLRVIFTGRASAHNVDGLIPAIDRLAKKLRGDLGENRAALRSLHMTYPAVTPSFEAFRYFDRAVRAVNLGQQEAGITLAREALALDPDFAGAWKCLGIAFSNVGQPDSAVRAFDETLRRPERLSPQQRYATEMLRADCVGDFEGAIAAGERMLQFDAAPLVAWSASTNLAGIYIDAGRFEEALALGRKVSLPNAFGETPPLPPYEILCLTSLGRLEEARVGVRGMAEPGRRSWQTRIASTACAWTSAESLAAALVADASCPTDQRGGAHLLLASAQAGRGEYGAALATYQHLDDFSDATANPALYRDLAQRCRLAFTVMSDGRIEPPGTTNGSDTPTGPLLTRALRAGIVGDQSQAGSLLAAARARSRPQLVLQGAMPVLVEARIAALSGDWGRTVRLLQPIAARRVEGALLEPAGLSVVRWLLADTFERLGMPDSAATYLEKVTSESFTCYEEDHLRGIAVPLVHQRLAMLYVRMGRLADAERHLTLLEKMWDRPDPIARRLLDEAQAAVASARGMTRPERPRT